VEAAEYLADAQVASGNGAHKYACGLAWRAAAAAARNGNEGVLAQVVELAAVLQAAGANDAEQLLRYAEACLEDARNGTRRASAFERLIARDKRPR
jgi:hypothetical protein